jgi:hypothetical protein
MLRLLIKDITVEKPLHAKQLLAHIRWQGGACTDLCVELPPNRADRVRYPTAVVDRVRHLGQSLPDGDIADGLNQEGQISALGKPFTASMIKWIRYRYQIPKARLVQPEELTVQQVAQRFGVSPNVVYYWIERGVIQARPRIGLHSTKQTNRNSETGCTTHARFRGHPQRHWGKVHYELTVATPNGRCRQSAFGI